MSDDGFIREVEEELRSDRLKQIWDRFGLIIIGVAVAAVLATAGYRGWDWYSNSQASASGDRFLEALNLANGGNPDAALAELEALQESGFGQYPVLARMRAATVRFEAGDADGAVADFDAIAGDRSVPVALRDMARLRAAYILVDHGAYEDVAARAEQLTSGENPLRHSAREALGLAAFSAGRMGDAQSLFDEIVEDPLAPAGLGQRANIMLDLIRASGAVVEG